MERLAGTHPPSRCLAFLPFSSFSLSLSLSLRLALTGCTTYPLPISHRGYYVNGRVVSNPTIQNPASGVNVPKFPRATLLNMHLLRFRCTGGGRGWSEMTRRRCEMEKGGTSWQGSGGMWGGNWGGGWTGQTGAQSGILSALQDARDWNAGLRYSASRNASVLGAR